MKVFTLEGCELTEQEFVEDHGPHIDQVDIDRVLALAVGETCPVMEMQTITRVK